MTTCTTFANSIKKRVETGKDLDTIAGELCTDVKFSREKVIRVIKDFLGEEFLSEHADTLGYDVEKAELAKKRKPYKKVCAPTCSDSDSAGRSISRANECKTGSEPVSEAEELTCELQRLVEKYGLEALQSAIIKLMEGNGIETTNQQH